MREGFALRTSAPIELRFHNENAASPLIAWSAGIPQSVFVRGSVNLSGTVAGPLGHGLSVWVGRCQVGANEWFFDRVQVTGNPSDRRLDWHLSPDRWAGVSGQFHVVAVMTADEAPDHVRTSWETKVIAFSAPDRYIRIAPTLPLAALWILLSPFWNEEHPEWAAYWLAALTVGIVLPVLLRRRRGRLRVVYSDREPDYAAMTLKRAGGLRGSGHSHKV